MLKIGFTVPIGVRGDAFSTVRLGEQWFKRAMIGNKLEVCDKDARRISVAEVVDVWSGPLIEAPAALLEMENDPLRRTYSGLLHSLTTIKRAHVDHHETITVLVLSPQHTKDQPRRVLTIPKLLVARRPPPQQE